MELPYNSAIPLLSMHPKKVSVSKDAYIPMCNNMNGLEGIVLSKISQRSTNTI